MSRTRKCNNRLIILFALMVAVAFSAFIPVYGEENRIEFTVNGTELIISGNGNMPDYTPQDPAPWTVHRKSITSVVIEEGVTSVGSMAFFSFTELESVSIPKGLVSVGDSGFYNCSSLTSISFGSGLAAVGEYAFEKCTALTEVSGLCAEIISEGAFSGCSALGAVDAEDAVTIEKYAFENCTSLGSVKLGAGLKSVGSFAFDGCCSISSLVYSGSREQFDGIEISDGNTAIENAEKIWHGGEHQYSEVIEVVAPGCTTEGYTLYGCSCGMTEKRDIKEQTGHSYVNYIARDEADTHSATISYCTSCGDCVYNAVESEQPPVSYSVTWVIGGLRFTEKYTKGSVPNGFSAFEYTAPNGARYSLEGFEPAIKPVTEDITYRAVLSPINGLTAVDGKTYCFVDGEKLTGWQEIGGLLYYFLKADGSMVTGVRTVGGVEYRFGDDGALYNGWYTSDEGTRYYKNGVMCRSWQTVEGKTYYFYVKTGLLLEEETATVGGFFREFNQDHSVKPISGWQLVDNKVYYYRDGEMQTGWQEIDGLTYYFLRSSDRYGEMTWGWQAIGGKLYYFYTYKGSLGNGGNLYSQSGYIGGVYYEISNEGYVKINRMFDDGTGVRYYDHTYTYVRNSFLTVGDKKYYFGADGYAYRGCIATIDGVRYVFDENGVCTALEE